jgi:hypothetical protein
MKTIILLLLILAANTSMMSQWVQTAGTPEGGGITSMVVTSNGTIVVTCSSFNFPSGQFGGIRHSTNQGATWVNDYQHYTARTVALGQNGYVWASSWDYPSISEGLWVSYNQGGVWVGHTYLIGSNNNIFSILVRDNNQTVYIGTRTGVRKSTNGGSTFTPVNNGIPANSWVRDLEIDSNGVIAAATTNGVFISTNSSASWNPVTGIPPADTIVSLMFNSNTSLDGDLSLMMGSDNNALYNSYDPYTTAALAYVFTFSNERELRDMRGDLNYKMIVISPRTTGNGGTLEMSTNGGITFTPINEGLPANPLVSSIEISNVNRGSELNLYLGLLGNSNGGAKVFTRVQPIGIQQISSEVPDAFTLLQNYPNPFNPVTNIEFAVAKLSVVKIAVYDMLGREVEILVNKELKPGSYKADWDASNYPSGVYFYKLLTDDFAQTKKMILVK